MEMTVSPLSEFLIHLTLTVYGISLVLILIYSLTQLNMLRYFLRYQKQKKIIK